MILHYQCTVLPRFGSICDLGGIYCVLSLRLIKIRFYSRAVCKRTHRFDFLPPINIARILAQTHPTSPPTTSLPPSQFLPPSHKSIPKSLTQAISNSTSLTIQIVLALRFDFQSSSALPPASPERNRTSSL